MKNQHFSTLFIQVSFFGKVKRRSFFYFLLLTFYFSHSFSQQNIAAYVDPFIGTGGHGHTFPGATVPFGMVQLSPDTRVDGSWDGCGGYHYSDSLIYGFSHTHLSGTGCSDYGDIALLPLDGKAMDAKKKTPPPPPLVDLNKIRSEFSHKNERAEAGFYSVKLDNGIKCDLTSSTRVGFHQYTFKNNYGRILLKVDHRDMTLSSDLVFVSDRIVEGYRRSEAWAKDQHIFFRIEFSEPYVLENSIGSKSENSNGETNTLVPYAFFSFPTLAEKKLKVKVAISFVSTEGAHKNMEAEIPHWDFEKAKTEAKELWSKELSKILVEGDSIKKTIFYTALYHCMVQPNIANDVDGKYRGRDNQIHTAEGHNYYSVFSLWDTFRGEHPLLTIIDRKRTSDFVKTFLLQYRQGGRLPVWELASNETDCMIGYHSVSVISDAISKGINDFDMKLALEAMEKSAQWNHLGLPAYAKKGFLEAEDEHESVSKTLEYAYDDWCIAQVAKLQGRNDEYQYYIRRAQSWRNMFDPSTGFMRPRKNGGWLSPFEPKEVNNYFTEGNSWQYSFFVPHDVEGLIESMGGNASFEKQLDKLFSEDSKTTGREQADITGLIGQYAHGNEPSHHMAYLYNYVYKPEKTEALVDKILNEMYKASPDGLCGNEDCGQMSAWYVLSSMGFYPVCPGNGFYDIGMPAFDKVSIQLENGKTFEVSIKNPHLKAKGKVKKQESYINAVLLGWNKLSYEKIMQGSKLDIYLAPNNGEQMAIDMESVPAVLKDYPRLLRAPLIVAPSQIFRDSIKVEILNYEKGKYVYYALQDVNDSAKLSKPVLYSKPFTVSDAVRVHAFLKSQGDLIEHDWKKDNRYTSAYFHKIPNNWTISISSKYNVQYTAGGDNGVIDGLRADANWRKGGWQGYQKQNFEAVVDLQKQTEIKEVGAGFLQDTRSWILMPKKVEFYVSADGKKYTKVAEAAGFLPDTDLASQVKNVQQLLKKPVTARYLKVKAINYGKLPKWHQGAGGDAFIFVDELWVK